jgi:hypothetical protein
MDLFAAHDLGTIAVDLRPGSTEKGAFGYDAVTAAASEKKKIA